MEPLKIKIENQSMILEFNEPNHHNPMGFKRREALMHCIKEAQKDDLITSIIITGGEGNSFCCGGDFNETRDFGGGEEVRLWNAHCIELHKTVLKCPKPVIVAMDKHAIGMGLQFALMSDWRIGTNKAQLTMPELKIGLGCTLGSSILEVVVGIAHTQAIVYSGTPIEAEKAYKIGLLNEVVITNLIDTALTRASTFSNYPGFSYTKAAINRKMLTALDNALEITNNACQKAFSEGKTQHFMRSILDRSKK